MNSLRPTADIAFVASDLSGLDLDTGENGDAPSDLPQSSMDIIPPKTISSRRIAKGGANVGAEFTPGLDKLANWPSPRATSTPIRTVGSAQIISARKLAKGSANVGAKAFLGSDPLASWSSPIATSTPIQGAVSAQTKPEQEQEGKPPVLEKHRPAFCLFVASLASALDENVLHEHVTEHFEAYGTILNVKVLRDPQDRPYAFVQYGSQEEMDLALEKSHRSLLDNREIRCEPARVNRTVLICSDYIEQPITFSGATQLCATYGQVENLTPFDGTIGNGMFVRFAYREDAAQAFAGLQAKTAFRVYWVQNLAESSNGSNGSYADPKQAFVGQLQPNVTEAQLREKFEGFGVVTGIEIKARPGASTATAFVHFATALATVQAIERLNHTMWMGRTIHVQARQDRSRIQPQLAPPPTQMYGNRKPFQALTNQQRNVWGTTVRGSGARDKKWKPSRSHYREQQGRQKQQGQPQQGQSYVPMYYQVPYYNFGFEPAH